MAHLTHARSSAGELGGKHLQHHKLMHDTAVSPRYSDQRSPPQSIPAKSTHQSGGRGNGQSGTKGVTDDDEEEDSSTAHGDEQEDEDDEQDALVPFHGRGKGKGKCPSIRLDPIDENESLGEEEEEEEEISSRGTGLIPSKHPVNQLLMGKKKRTFSNLSSTSVLFGDDMADQDLFPRRKLARKLSNMASKPLLTYKESNDAAHVKSYENAIESDDEDYSGVNLVPDDDESDMENMEQQEESFIVQDQEQQATTLLNQFRDARRLSLDSTASDDIFNVTAPLSDAFMAGLPDFGFAQFFEPDAVPTSPDPAAKRKYSDSSTKRVRFDDEVQVSDDSSSESSELDSSVFPDLFLEQDKLPPILHQLLEADNDDDGDMGSPMSDASFWDFGQEESRITQADDSDDESSAGSSGYESMVVTFIRLPSITNMSLQPTWVIPLTKKTLDQTLHRRLPFKRSPCCANRPQRQVLELRLLTPSRGALGQPGARFPPLGVSSFMTIAQRPLPSRTGLPRL
jgi:hypothetical protein